MHHCTHNKIAVAICISEQVDFMTRNITMDEEKHFKMMKSTYQEEKQF